MYSLCVISNLHPASDLHQRSKKELIIINNLLYWKLKANCKTWSRFHTLKTTCLARTQQAKQTFAEQLKLILSLFWICLSEISNHGLKYEHTFAESATSAVNTYIPSPGVSPGWHELLIIFSCCDKLSNRYRWFIVVNVHLLHSYVLILGNGTERTQECKNKHRHLRRKSVYPCILRL